MFFTIGAVDFICHESKLCQLIDFGEWADEEKSIPCGANKDQEIIKLSDFDIEDIEAMLSEQSEDFFKE